MKPTRTFIAIDPGKTIRDRLVALQENLAKTGADVKWVEHDNLHLTLLFLGEVDQRDLVDVCRVVADATATQQVFPMSIEKAGCFGSPRRPRTIWVGVGNGKLEVCKLHDVIEPALLDLGCYRREERDFTPHLTLGRVKSAPTSNTMAAALAKHAAWKGGETMVRELLVMGSELTSNGPVYTVLSRARLKSC